MTTPELRTSELTRSEQLAAISRLDVDEQWGAVRELATPLFVRPPAERWGTIQVTPDKDKTLLVPFTDEEVIAVAGAHQAYTLLLREGASSSGPAREFMLESQLFPRRSADLHQRDHAVWGILSASVAAHRAMELDAGTAWEPRGETAAAFVIMQTLPDSLIAH